MRPLSLLATALLLTPLALDAQDGRDAAERRADRRQLGVDRAQALGDVGDVRRLERLVAELDAARTAADKEKELAVQLRIAAELRREAAEGRRDVVQDRAETRGARREVRADRTRDDRRDLRDDRRDARASADRARRQQEILTELRGLQGDVASGSDVAVARQRTLLDEFLTVARDDARATGRELGEDRRELREDRRP